MSATLANALRVIGVLLLVLVWCFGVIPLFPMPPIVALLISVPPAVGLSIYLAVSWRDA
jgi:hypothetical protein